MTTLYLPNHDVLSRVLVTTGDLGRLEESRRDALPADAREVRAFWVEFEGEPVGVYASPSGPIAFAGEQRLALAQGRSKATIVPVDGRRRLFQLTHDGAVWFTADHEEPGSTGGAWDDEEILDFYAWLAKELEDPAFWAYWTAPLPVQAPG